MSSMLHVLSTLKGLLKSKKLHIDHWAFRLHYRITVLFLLLFCILVSTKQYAGEPIKCSPDTQTQSSLVETYCFITSTYTVTAALNLTPSEGAPHPGVYPSQNTADFRYHTYYQWVGFILLVQAIFFYIPHWLWKMFEGGELSSLLERDPKLLPQEERDKFRNSIITHLRSKWTKDKYYLTKYLFCEILCVVNLVGQMAFLDSVFFNEYFYFGFETLHYFRGSSESAISPLLKIFPKVTCCTYRYFGSTGKIQSESVLCVLAVNVINEKIFLFLWFWFVILAIVSFGMLFLKVALFSIATLRLTVLCFRFPSVRREDFQLIVETGNVNNFLFLYLLGMNMNESSFVDIIECFATVQRGKIN